MTHLESGSGLFICPTPREVKTSLWMHKSQVEKGFCKLLLILMWWSLKETVLRILYSFSCLVFFFFVGLSLPLLLFRFCGFFVWFYFFAFHLPKLSYLNRTISLVFRKCQPFFLQWAALWVLMQQYIAGCKHSWVYGVDRGARRNYR